MSWRCDVCQRELKTNRGVRLTTRHRDCDLALTGGRWVRRGLVWHWRT